MSQVESSQASSPHTNRRTKKTFTPEEDQKITIFVQLIGTKKWSLIAKYVTGRTAKQCRDRYMNYLKPGLSNLEWTHDEDNFLLELYSRFGPKWAKINKYFQNRNQISLKNRFQFLQKFVINDNNFNNNQYHIENNNSVFQPPKLNDVIETNVLNNLIPDLICVPENNEVEQGNKSIQDEKSLKQVNINENEESIFNMDNMFDLDDELSSYFIF